MACRLLGAKPLSKPMPINWARRNKFSAIRIPQIYLFKKMYSKALSFYGSHFVRPQSIRSVDKAFIWSQLEMEKDFIDESDLLTNDPREPRKNISVWSKSLVKVILLPVNRKI